MDTVTNHHLFKLTESLRVFFKEHGFVETLTPPIVQSPGIETHIHPFQLYSPHKKELIPLYLHTSPEFYMKRLLSEGMEKIYQISYAFRDEPDSSTHRKQFLMLEWYRANSHYDDIKKDVSNLIKHVTDCFNCPFFEVKYMTVDELFQKYLNFSILDYIDTKKLKNKIIQDFPHYLKDDHEHLWPWEDYFFLLFLNEIEPHFKDEPFLMVDKFPSPLAALSTISPVDHRVCERFEIYMHGLEVANCFNELRDLDEQKKRYQKNREAKHKLYDYQVNEPSVLFRALEKGIRPSSGIAMGLERLLMGIFKLDEAIFLD